MDDVEGPQWMFDDKLSGKWQGGRVQPQEGEDAVVAESGVEPLEHYVRISQPWARNAATVTSEASSRRRSSGNTDGFRIVLVMSGRGSYGCIVGKRWSVDGNGRTSQLSRSEPVSAGDSHTVVADTTRGGATGSTFLSSMLHSTAGKQLVLFVEFLRG